MTTTKPGPYALLLRGTSENAKSISMQIRQQTTSIHVPDALAVLPIEDTGDPLLLDLLSDESLPLPSMQLLAKGDPIATAWNPEEAPAMNLPGIQADAILVFFTPSKQLKSNSTITVAVSNAAAKMTLTPTEPTGKAVLERELSIGKPWQLNLSASNETSVQGKIAVQPLFTALDCHAGQKGIYVFDSYGKSGEPLPVAAYLLEQGQASAKIPEDTWLGCCRVFIPAGSILTSSLEDDAIFRFDGFSSRERSREPGKVYQRWTSSGHASVTVAAPPETKCRITLSIASSCPQSVTPRHATVSIGSKVIPLEFSKGSCVVETETTTPEDSRRGLTINLKSRTWQPSDFPPSRDNRTLGLLINHLEVEYVY